VSLTRMETVPEDVIEQVWMRQCEMDEEDTQALVARFLEEQPYIAAYLLAANDDEEEEEEEENAEEDSQLIPLATLVWGVFTDGVQQVPTVEGEDLTAAEERNIKLLETADESSETGMTELAERLFLEYNQRPLLQFALEVLMSDHEENPENAPGRVGLDLLYLKTVIDCLDSAV
jgi:hypothetical protein